MDKWQNVSAGPRQVKDFNRAVSNLTSEGKTVTELYGVVGGKESSSTLMHMFGAPRAEVVALDEAIREKYGYQVTSGNVRAIIADYEAALPKARESRPVDDQRRSQAEDAELQAKIAGQEAKRQAEQDAANAVLEQVLAKAPAGAKALIVAEYHEDASDPMTDYFNSRTVRTVAIGWRYSSREDFRALHAAAAQFPETAHMTGQDMERRENYSMGSGNYVSDHGSAKSGTGWVVRSRDLPCRWVTLTEDAIPATPASTAVPIAVTGDGAVTVSPSSLGKAGVVEIRFADKPAEEVRADLKAHGFRWARTNGCWYGRDTAYAETLAQAS